MGINENLIKALNRTIELAGTQIRIRYYDSVYDTVYDEPVGLNQSGTDLWTSGVVFSLNTRDGSSDSVLLKEGKLINSDKKVYLNGSLVLTGGTQTIDLQLGSPTGELYTTIEDGGNVKEVQGQPVYKKQFIRQINGSLLNG